MQILGKYNIINAKNFNILIGILFSWLIFCKKRPVNLFFCQLCMY